MIEILSHLGAAYYDCEYYEMVLIYGIIASCMLILIYDIINFF
jgi:hypothetical protein